MLIHERATAAGWTSGGAPGDLGHWHGGGAASRVAAALRKPVMRILQIAPPWFSVPPSGYGGTEQTVSLLAEGLVHAGHEVVLVASGGSTTAGRLVTTFARPPTGQLGDAELELAHALAGYRLAGEVDLIHDHTTLGPALGALLDGPPVVHTLHGPWTASTVELSRRISDRVSLVAISHDQADRTPAHIRLAGMVHNGIDVAAHPYVATKDDYLAYVGRACPEKAPELAIEVARRLDRRLLLAVKVNQPDEHDYFATHIAPALDRGDVELVDVTSHADKCTLLGGATAVLFPASWPEPFGLVPVEANACGTPVVAFANGAVPEVIEHGRNGLLVAPGDLDAFTEATEQISQIPPASCRQTALERFAAAQMVANYQQLYQRLVPLSTATGGLPPATRART